MRIAAILAVALVVAWLFAFGGLGRTVLPSLTGVPDLRAKLLLVALVGLAIARLAGRPAIAAIAVGVGVYAWVPGVDPISDPETLEQARQYREVQDWARQNTPPDSLFMTDPAHSYGWRHYSQRPSFGTMREWLYSGWLYNTQPELMAEGLRRAEALGASRVEMFAPDHPIGERYAATAREMTTRHNAASSGLLAELHDQFGVDYFVFDRTKLSGSADLPRPLFENGRYVVVAAPEA